MAISLRNHVWQVVRAPAIVYGVVTILVAAGTYVALLGWVKQNTLRDRLRVAHITVLSSVEAGDWDIAFTNLRANAQAGQLYNLRLLSADGKTNLIGPIGDVEFGFGTYCTEDKSNSHFRLGGCTRIIGLTEIYYILGFTIFTLLSLVVSFVFFRRQALSLFDSISKMLTAKDLDKSSGIEEIEVVRARIASLCRKVESTSKSKALAELATQVAHDIRSPLAALNMILEHTKDWQDERKVIIRSAVGRIQDIAGNLIERNRDQTAKNYRPEQVATVVENIVSEKTLEFSASRNITFVRDYSPSAHSFFAVMQPREFATALSNVINNAVEAISGAGTITIKVSEQRGKAIVRVTDTGAGIPAEVLPRLGERGATFGKANGSGLGLHYLRSKVESWGGSVAIASEVGKGTSVEVSLPLVAAPRWFVSELNVTDKDGVIVIDDDPMIHTLWKRRLKNSVHFTDPTVALRWCQDNATAAQNKMFVVDYEYAGHAMNGLELIRSAGVAANSILVTGRYDDDSIMNACVNMGVQLLPKPLLEHFPIKQQEIACQ